MTNLSDEGDRRCAETGLHFRGPIKIILAPRRHITYERATAKVKEMA